MTNAVRTLPTPLGLSDFDVGVTLGTGSFGRVRFATHKVDKAPFTSIPLISSEDYWLFLGYKNVEEGRGYSTSASKCYSLIRYRHSDGF